MSALATGDSARGAGPFSFNREAGAPSHPRAPRQGSWEPFLPEVTVNQAVLSNLAKATQAAELPSTQLTLLISLTQLGTDALFISYNLLGQINKC